MAYRYMLMRARGFYMRRYSLLVMVSVFLVLTAVLVSVHLSSHSRGAERRSMQEITAYTSLPTEAAMALTEEYETEHNIRVNFIQIPSEEIFNRLKEQSEGTGHGKASLVLAEREVLDRAAAAGYLVPYASEKSDQVPASFRHEKGYWTGVWYDPIVFAVNQDYLRTHLDLPNSWQMLTQQRDIRIGTTDFMAADAASNLLYSMIAEYGEQQTFDMWRAIQPKIMQYSRYLHTPVRQAGMGEVDLSIAVLSETLRYVRDDYPIRVLYPTDGTCAVVFGTGIAFRAAERDAREAEQFADWLLTDEAQRALARHRFYFLTTNPATLAYQTFAGKNITMFQSHPYFTKEEKEKLLDRWVKKVRLSGE